MAEDNNRKQLIGQVLESKMRNTAVVRIDSRKPHPVYKKYINRSKKYYAHDPNNLCGLGDSVIIEESKPVSKLKRWRIKKVQEKAIN